MVSSKLEFVVENIKDSNRLRTSLLSVPGITKVEVVKNELVLLETALSCTEAKDVVEEHSGTRAVLQGFGVGGSAVVIVEGQGPHGVIRLSQSISDHGSLVDGTIDNLTPGEHLLNIHVSGDLSQGCQSIGPVLQPLGNLGSIEADSNGRANFKFTIPDLQVNDILGRSVAIMDPNEKKSVACGIIARSAGLFENNKKICACDGVTLWDERDIPIAGHGRRKDDTPPNSRNNDAKL